MLEDEGLDKSRDRGYINTNSLKDGKSEVSQLCNFVDDPIWSSACSEQFVEQFPTFALQDILNNNFNDRTKNVYCKHSPIVINCMNYTNKQQLIRVGNGNRRQRHRYTST